MASIVSYADCHDVVGAGDKPSRFVRFAGSALARRAIAAGRLIAARSRTRAFARDRRASTAVEFAIVSAMLIPTILFILLVGLVLYFNQALDYATSKASRQIMVGNVQTTGMTQAAFQSLVCSYLPASFNCANVIVNVQTATEASQPGGYYTFATSNQSWLIIPSLSNSSATFSPGTAGSYEYVQVIYPITFIPSLLAPFLGGATYQGASAYLVVSTAAFRNEQFI